MPRYASLKKRARWSEESLLRAIESVKKEMSLRKVAKEYNIPRTTLYQNLSQTSAKKLPLGGKPLLKDLEADLVKHVLEMQRSLFGITARDLGNLLIR